MKAKLTAAVAALKSGSPHEEDTYIGPIIAVKEAERIEAWVKEALDKGALLDCNFVLAWRASHATAVSCLTRYLRLPF